MRSRNNLLRASVLFSLVLLLITVSLLAVSCGKKTTTQGESSGTTVTTGIPEVDNYASESDAATKSVNADDFSDSNINDTALGI